nr:hypothetical protein [Tanacetum cinerariifolium]
MKLEECATWDGGKITWGFQVGAMGTVPVCVCTREAGGGSGVVVAGVANGGCGGVVVAARWGCGGWCVRRRVRVVCSDEGEVEMMMGVGQKWWPTSGGWPEAEPDSWPKKKDRRK